MLFARILSRDDKHKPGNCGSKSEISGNANYHDDEGRCGSAAIQYNIDDFLTIQSQQGGSKDGTYRRSTCEVAYDLSKHRQIAHGQLVQGMSGNARNAFKFQWQSRICRCRSGTRSGHRCSRVVQKKSRPKAAWHRRSVWLRRCRSGSGTFDRKDA